MESLIKADIFFFISSVATIVLTVLISILLFYLIKAGKTLSSLSDTLKNSFEESEEFLLDLKDRLASNLIFRLLFPASQKRRKTSNKKSQDKSN